MFTAGGRRRTQSMPAACSECRLRTEAESCLATCSQNRKPSPGRRERGGGHVTTSRNPKRWGGAEWSPVFDQPKTRRGRDLNPRSACTDNGFQDRRHKPDSATPPRATAILGFRKTHVWPQTFGIPVELGAFCVRRSEFPPKLGPFGVKRSKKRRPRALSRPDQLYPAHVRPQRLGHRDHPVRALVRLEDRVDRAGQREP